MRSPRRQRASSRRRKVNGPTTPSTVSPRCCWKVRTASSTRSSKNAPSGGSPSTVESPRSPLRSSRPGIWATAGPESPCLTTPACVPVIAATVVVARIEPASADVVGQLLEQRGLSTRADVLLDCCAFLVQVERGDAVDAVRRRGHRVLVDVQLDEGDLVAVL